MNLKTILQIAIGGIGYLAWAIMAYFDSSQRAAFLQFNIGAVLGTVGLVLRDMPPPKPDGDV